MNEYVVYFKRYLENNPPNYEYDEIHSLLELFGSYYTTCNPGDNDKIREHFCSLEPIMKSMSRKRERQLFNTTLNICDEFKRTAFQEGIRVGAQLILELLGE